MNLDAKGTLTRSGDIWNYEDTHSWTSSISPWNVGWQPEATEGGLIHIVTYDSASGGLYQYQVVAYVKRSLAQGYVQTIIDIGDGGNKMVVTINTSGLVIFTPSASFTGTVRYRRERFWQ